ncbi:GntR family transcriptional regulator [Nitratireductor aquibiodomus RA22]|uniref:Transcriptional regulator, GntR family n=3 Tax=Nitratireductor TaxID=245876 RepID=A0A1H4JES7_9HYPH|nr:GntR family transcriptional regulator [Nitratireductor aquibiodomus RA22]SEB44824.1 transcriptional regulator, GntR family [Nitratireductor aquibiodomus]
MTVSTMEVPAGRSTRPRVRLSVAQSIARDIFSGKFAEGTNLPRENDLCEEYGVSRTVIRETLKILQAKGLVVSRPRIGTIVCRQDEWNILDTQVLEWIGPNLDRMGLVDCILEARGAIEPMAAELAARRATMQEIADIEAAWQAMAAAGNDVEAFIAADIVFHEHLLKASHNRIFQQFGALMDPALNFMLSTSAHSAENLEESIGQHGALVEALRLRDAEGARKLALALIAKAKHDVSAARSVKP